MDFRNIDRFRNVTILVIGDYILDQYVNGDVERISPEAPIPVVRATWVKEQLGGAGNVVNNIQALNGKARVLTCFGCDHVGDDLLAHLEATGADTSFILREPSVETIKKIRVTSRGQQIVRVDYEKQKPSEIPPFIEYIRNTIDPALEGVDCVVISDYGKGIVTDNLMRIVVSATRSRSIPIIVDPKGKDWSKYRGVTMCTPNLSEFSDVVGRKIYQEMESDILSEAVALCEKLDMSQILVTRSERGMSFISRDGFKSDFPVRKKFDVIDVSGAGDTVVSVMALSMSIGLPYADCCTLANLAASVAVSRFGTSPVTYDDLKALQSNDVGLNIATCNEIGEISNSLHSAGKKIVFTNGCFDILHAGHIHSLEFAKSMGDVLIVGINSDDSVRRLKGPTRPVVDQDNRAHLLKSLRMVDYVVIFDEDTPLELIKAVQPDVLVKGEDYLGKEVVGRDVVEARGGVVRLVDLKPGLSTSNIIKKIIESYKE